MDINNITLTGRLTKDIELKQTQSGKTVTSFSIATNKDRDTVYFIDCVAWNKSAELLAQYTRKGSKIGVTGVLTNRTYENNSGQKVKVTEVLVNNLTFLDSKQSEDGGQQRPQSRPQQSNSGYYADSQTLDVQSDDLPF